MVKLILRILFCFSFFLCISCTPQHKAPAGNPYFAACKTTCEKRAQICNKDCRNSCPQCSRAATQKAAKNYARYINERCIRGEIIALELNSFRDPLQCRKVTCNCRADFDVCMQACSGVIHKRLQDAPVCC